MIRMLRKIRVSWNAVIVVLMSLCALLLGNSAAAAIDPTVLPSMSCNINADCKNAIFSCSTANGGGVCTQIEMCTSNSQCQELYGGAVSCKQGTCQMENNPSSDEENGQNSGGSTSNGCRNGQDCVPLTNPLSSTDIPKIIGSTVQVVVGIVGMIAFVVFVYGGFQWLTSAGNSEKISKGLQAMLWAGIGIIVVFSSYAILTLILKTLQATP